MAAADSDYYTYVRFPGLTGFILIGCVSSESIATALQTSNKPICRSNKRIRKNNDGTDSTASFQIEDDGSDGTALIHWFSFAAHENTDIVAAFLTLPIDDAATEGIVIEGAFGNTWTRDVNNRNANISLEPTCGSWLWAKWLAEDPANNTNALETDTGAAGFADQLPAL